ncbi:bromodomain-containing protein 8-like [Huso huso]|uniref:Bromodomain-containing protein 8-like n=1 Tax=Huso huso TaxID=61971 RepID=A0ABR0YTD7_HUSHU
MEQKEDLVIESDSDSEQEEDVESEISSGFLPEHLDNQGSEPESDQAELGESTERDSIESDRPEEERDGTESEPLEEEHSIDKALNASLEYSSLAESSPERQTCSQQNKKILRQTWNVIASHKYAYMFLKPVNEKFAPEYYRVVKRPMDLLTLKRRVAKGLVDTLEGFQGEVMLMFQNAMMYNDPDSEVYRRAVSMQGDIVEHLQMLI